MSRSVSAFPLPAHGCERWTSALGPSIIYYSATFIHLSSRRLGYRSRHCNFQTPKSSGKYVQRAWASFSKGDRRKHSLRQRVKNTSPVTQIAQTKGSGGPETLYSEGMQKNRHEWKQRDLICERGLFEGSVRSRSNSCSRGLSSPLPLIA